MLSPFKSDRSHFFAHIRNLIQNGKVHFFGDQYFSITLGDSHLRGGGGAGGFAWIPTPGFQPSYSRPILSSLPRPIFSLFFFGYPRPKFRFFAKAPSPYILPLPLPISPPPPPPRTDCGLAIVFIQCVNCFLCVCVLIFNFCEYGAPCAR